MPQRKWMARQVVMKRMHESLHKTTRLRGVITKLKQSKSEVTLCSIVDAVFPADVCLEPSEKTLKTIKLWYLKKKQTKNNNNVSND